MDIPFTGIIICAFLRPIPNRETPPSRTNRLIRTTRAILRSTLVQDKKSPFLGDSLNQKPPGLPVQDRLAVFDWYVVAGAVTCAQRADLKQKDHEFIMVFLVAGAGLEPATFGL
jgi:hypothetical protein